LLNANLPESLQKPDRIHAESFEVSILWTFQIKLDNFWALFFPINTPRPFAGGDIEGKNNG